MDDLNKWAMASNLLANSKGSDQPAYLCSLIGTFVVPIHYIQTLRQDEYICKD